MAEKNKLTFDEILAKAKELYGYIDTIFETNPELKKLLIDAVNSKMLPDQFAKQLTGTQWYVQNGQTIQARGFSKRTYEALVRDIPVTDPDYARKVQDATRNTDYARGLDTAKATLEAQLTTKGIAYTATELDTWAKELYDSANEKNTAYINRFLNTKIKFNPAKPTGNVADNLEDIKAYAVKQGFDLDKDFTQVDITSWMQRLDMGDSLAAIKKEIETKAMIGQPESVKTLMRQGLTVSDVYQPYVNRVSAKLQKANMTMKDPWFQKNMFNDKGELKSLWEMDMATMKHPDWEFTDDAHEQVGNSALRVLRDMGLQG
jgi:hypothetical protein